MLLFTPFQKDLLVAFMEFNTLFITLVYWVVWQRSFLLILQFTYSLLSITASHLSFADFRFNEFILLWKVFKALKCSVMKVIEDRLYCTSPQSLIVCYLARLNASYFS